MTNTYKKIIYWSPRVLCILFAVFISLFALDVFEEGQGFWKTLGALFMHLIPTFLLILLLIVSWKREWIGAVALALLAILYIIIAWGKFPISVYLFISGPLLIISVLFLFNWLFRSELKNR